MTTKALNDFISAEFGRGKIKIESYFIYKTSEHMMFILKNFFGVSIKNNKRQSSQAVDLFFCFDSMFL